MSRLAPIRGQSEDRVGHPEIPEGLPLDPLVEDVGKDLDPFDLICHVPVHVEP